MEVKLSYSKEQLEAAVEFIATHNPSFIGQSSYIRNSIMESMRRMAREPTSWLSGTMGYILWGDRIFEDMESDENTIHIDIAVDLCVGKDSTYIEEKINVY